MNVNNDLPNPAPSGVEVDMDGRLLWFKDRPDSLGQLLEHLARRSFCQRRVVQALHVDGMRVHPDKASQVLSQFSQIKLQTTSLDEIRARRLREAQAQTEHLRQQLRALSLVVLINEFQNVRNLWQGLIPLLRQLLLDLWNLEELRDPQNTQAAPLWDELKKHLEQIEIIFSRLEWMLLEFQDQWGLGESVQFSEQLENSLGQWLQDLSLRLSRLQDHLAV